MNRIFGVAAVVVWFGGCTFHSQLDASCHAAAEITCSADAPTCPAGYQCETALGLCVAESCLASTPPPTLHGAALEPAMGNGTPPFVLRFDVDEPLAAPPEATVNTVQPLADGGGLERSFSFACAACDPAAPCTCTYAIDPNAPPPESPDSSHQIPLDVGVTLLDAVGRTVHFPAVASFEYDATPPSLSSDSPTLTLVPASDGGPIPEVAALTQDGRAEVCFSLDEPIADGGVVFGERADGVRLAFSFEPLLSSGLRSCASTTVPEADAGTWDGAYRIVADLSDRAGNRAHLVLFELDAGLQLDTLPPMLPNLDADGGLRFRRAPWGEAPTIGTPAFSLGSPGVAFAEEGWLEIDADAEGTQRVAMKHVAAGALARVPLAISNLSTVYVRLFDTAGNAATPLGEAVQNVDWVASLGGANLAAPSLNPHRCVARPAGTDARIQPDDAQHELDARNGPVGLLSDGGASTVSGAASWRQRLAGSAQGSELWAFDSARRQLVSFSPQLDDAMTFDGIDYLAHGTAGALLGQRKDVALAEEPTSGRILLFGGAPSNSARVLCDTWAFDGTSWQELDACGPTARSHGELLFDPLRQTMLLFGGTDHTGAFIDDEWEWNGYAWRLLTADAGSGLDATGHGRAVFMRWSDGGGATVVDGCPHDGGAPVPFIGTWNGDHYAWSFGVGGALADIPFCTVLVDPASQVPSSVGFAPMDGGTAELTLAEANAGDGGWSLWPIASVAVPTDGGSLGHILKQAAWSSPQGSNVGLLISTDLPNPDGGDLSQLTTWLCVTDGGATRCTASHGVPVSAGTQGALVPDPRRNALLAAAPGLGALLCGGDEADGGDYVDTWRFQQGEWKPLGPAHFDTARHALLGATGGAFWTLRLEVDGGTAAESLDVTGNWGLAGNGFAWSPHTTTAIDAPTLGGLTYFNDGPCAKEPCGVNVFEPTGSPDGGPTTIQLGQPLGAAISPGIAFDLTRGVLEISEVDDSLDERGDGGWQTAATLARSSVLASDPVTGLTVAVATNGSETQLWDGLTLTTLPLADPEGDGAPNTRGAFALAPDPDEQGTLLFGGNASQFLQDTWLLALGGHPPAEVCDFAFSAEPIRPLQLSEIRIQADASATRGLQNAPLELDVWRRGTWSALATCDGTAAACTFDIPISDATALRDALTFESTLGVRITAEPESTSRAFATVRVPSLQAVFSYRLQ